MIWMQTYNRKVLVNQKKFKKSRDSRIQNKHEFYKETNV